MIPEEDKTHFGNKWLHFHVYSIRNIVFCVSIIDDSTPDILHQIIIDKKQLKKSG